MAKYLILLATFIETPFHRDIRSRHYCHVSCHTINSHFIQLYAYITVIDCSENRLRELNILTFLQRLSGCYTDCFVYSKELFFFISEVLSYTFHFFTVCSMKQAKMGRNVVIGDTYYHS